MEDQIKPVKMYNIGSDGNDEKKKTREYCTYPCGQSWVAGHQRAFLSKVSEIALKVMCIPTIASNT